MAYETGTATGVADLISKLNTFLTAQGFTFSSTWTNSTNTLGSITKGGNYWIYQYATSGATTLVLTTATGSTGTGLITAQPGVPSLQCWVNNIGGPYVAYHFFTDGSRVNVAIEKVAGVFSHINFGSAQKLGSWSGGSYVTGLYTEESSATARGDLLNGLNSVPFSGKMDSNTPTTNARGRRGHIRVPTAGAGVALLGQVPGTGTYSAYYIATGLQWEYQSEVLDASPNTFNNRAILAPVNIGHITANTVGTNPLYLIAVVPNVALVRIDNLSPGDLVNGDWLVFPISQKNGPATTYVNSGTYGIAYRK